jgi:tRNA modification GTPase
VGRSHQAIADADLVLLLVDGSDPRTWKEIEASSNGTRRLIVRNKSDLPSFVRGDVETALSEIVVDVSALTGEGLEELRAAIITSFGDSETADSGLLITDARQHDLLRRAAFEVESSVGLLQDGHSEELIVIGLKNALRLIGDITGETTTEDILTEIFATFCIGK